MDTANSKAIVMAIKFFAGIIIIAAVTYSEILFLGIVGGLFPAGPLAVGAIVGAITTGLSILALCLAKSHWFRPGTQLIVAWTFTLIEIVVLIANDILAYELHTSQSLDQYTQDWRTFCVAAPAISLVGWILLFYFSPERSILHKRMEMEDNQKAAQIDFEAMMHRKAMDVQRKAASMVGSRLEEKIECHMEYQLDRAASRFAAKIASQLTGEHVSSENLSGHSAKVVEAGSSKQLAASREHVVDPHGIKQEVDDEKKKIIRETSRKIERASMFNFSLPKMEEEKIDTLDISEEEESAPQTEIDLMALPIDERWQEYSKQTPQTTSKKKRKMTRREVLGMEEKGED